MTLKVGTTGSTGKHRNQTCRCTFSSYYCTRKPDYYRLTSRCVVSNLWVYNVRGSYKRISVADVVSWFVTVVDLSLLVFESCGSYRLNDHTLEQVPSNPYLGVQIQEDLKWKEHINNVTKNAGVCHWGTVSNALEKSRMAISNCFFLSNDCSISSAYSTGK
jgi:hypothetical protein